MIPAAFPPDSPANRSQQALREQGFPTGSPPASEQLVPGGGRWAVPHFQTFASIINIVSRSYKWSFDEALKDSQANALAMRRDPVIMDALRSRQLPTSQLDWHIKGNDPDDETEKRAIGILTDIIKGIPRFHRIRKQLLEATFYGRYGVQFTYAWDWSLGYKRMVATNHRPVNGDKIIFKYSGEVGILVQATWNAPHPAQIEYTDRGRAYFLNPLERKQFIIHEFEPEDADFFEGELAGQVHGVGLRSRLYWFWWLRNEVQAWLMDYLERVGAGGILVYWFEAGNPASEAAATHAAANADRDHALVLPRPIGHEGSGPGVQQIGPSEAGSNLLQSLITDYFDSVIRNYILGQTLTSRTGSTGMGSGVAQAHEDTFQRIINDDAMNLGDTMTQDFVRPLQEYNCPWCKTPLRWEFDVAKPNPRDFLAAARQFWDMDGEIDEDQLRSIIGLSRPKPGARILKRDPGQQVPPPSLKPIAL